MSRGTLKRRRSHQRPPKASEQKSRPRRAALTMISAFRTRSAAACLIAFVTGAFLWYRQLPTWVLRPTRHNVIDWGARRDLVKDAFLASWKPYVKHAWGKSFRATVVSMRCGSLIIVSAQVQTNTTPCHRRITTFPTALGGS